MLHVSVCVVTYMWIAFNQALTQACPRIMQHPTSEKDMNYSQNAFESDMKNFLIKISVVMKIAFQTLL